MGEVWQRNFDLPYGRPRLSSKAMPLPRTEDRRVPWPAWLLAIPLLFIGLYVWDRLHPFPGHFDARMRPYVRYVEARTGTEFKHAIRINMLSDTAFDAAFSDMIASGSTHVPSGYQCSKDGTGQRGSCEAFDSLDLSSPDAMIYLLVGLEPPESANHKNRSRSAYWHDTNGGDLSGFYSEDAQELYVRGTDPVKTGSVIVHELVHAWQDQHGFLDGMSFSLDRSFTRSALVEGQARMIEDDYWSSLSGAALEVEAEGETERFTEWVNGEKSELASVDDAARRAQATELEINGWPYEEGSRFLRELRRQQGFEGIERVFREGVSSTWEISHPAQYLRGVVLRPAPRGRRFGSVVPYHARDAALSIGAMLWSTGVGSVLDEEAAAILREGWRGDSVLIAQVGPRVCVVNNFRANDAPTARRVESVLRNFVRVHPWHDAAIVVRPSGDSAFGVQIEGCVPAR